jgi:D-beta-D-heptose 7-phosphate kinase/D-beta-D-heptose 1-phosphate adenosyltransferase
LRLHDFWKMPEKKTFRETKFLKIRSRRWLARATRQLKQQGLRIVFTNGCFDLLHPGHVTLLKQAKCLGDVLIVGVNSDRSVRAVKGVGRPIVRQQDRATLLAALASVDYVTVFDEPTPSQLIAELKPDVLVKGTDWRLKDVVGRELVRQHGGRVVRIPLVDGYSTTQLLSRIRHPREHRTPPSHRTVR